MPRRRASDPTPPASTRQVIAIPGEADDFEHDYIIYPEQEASRVKRTVATCHTPRPAARCSCYFYDLVWEPKPPA